MTSHYQNTYFLFLVAAFIIVGFAFFATSSPTSAVPRFGGVGVADHCPDQPGTKTLCAGDKIRFDGQQDYITITASNMCKNARKSAEHNSVEVCQDQSNPPIYCKGGTPCQENSEKKEKKNGKECCTVTVTCKCITSSHTIAGAEPLENKNIDISQPQGNLPLASAF